MDKLKQAMEELRSVNTNDPVMQKRVVKVLDLILVELDRIKNPPVYMNFGGQ